MSGSYPCIQCFEHCSEPCIQCSMCDRWVHITCVPMTESQLKTWDNHLLKFYCQQCCYSGIDFDALQSLERLRMSLESGKRNALLTTAKNEDLLLRTYNVSIPPHTEQTVHEPDYVSHKVLQMFHPVMLCDYYPASVLGDGNCMYRAVSRALSGTEQYHTLLRLKTALEVILNRQYYDHKSKSYKDLISDNRVIVSDYDKLVRDSITIGSYSELAHIYALSASLGQPLRSYFPPQICSEFLSEPFTRKVVGRKVKDNVSVASIMWTQMQIPRSARDFRPNHFVPLIPRENPIIEVIDLNGPSNTPDNSVMSMCTTNQSIDKSLPSDIGASAVDLPEPVSCDSSLFSNVDAPTVVLPESVSCDSSLFSNVDASTVVLPEPVSCDSSLFSNVSEHCTETSCHNVTIDPVDEKCRSVSCDSSFPSDSNVEPLIEPVAETIENTNLSEPPSVDVSHECVDDESRRESVCEDESVSDSTSTQSFVQQFDRKTCDHLDGAFLKVDEVIRVLAENEKPLEYIPDGVKENVYFVIRNEKNIMTRGRKNRSNFRDDCGVWESGKGTTPKSSFLILPSGDLKKIVKRRDQNDLYCFENKSKGKFYYTPLNPQPSENEVLHLHRYYAYLKENNNYRKRVSWLSQGGNKDIAIAEYIGDYPGLAPHGNSKHKPEYVRTPHQVMVEMGEMLKTNKPQHVYDKLTAKYDELSGPANFQQVYNKRNRDRAKERKDNGQIYHRSNFADHIKEIENQVTANHPFIRSVIRQNGRAPSIILYSDEQIIDLKNLCCTGQTVLGVDKTFNLCDMHVTVSCYKQLAVKRDTTDEPPLFFGPLYVHDNSDFESYSTFFSHLKTKLSGVDTSKLVIGTDDERALVNAITSSFSDANHVLCTRHMRQNVNQKLTDAAVDKSDRQMLLNKIFGEDGIINADDTVCFEEKCEEVEAASQSVSQPFLRYFQKRVKDNLNRKRKEPELISRADKQWTNNNCESLNHVLKQNIEWKSKPLLDLIEAIYELVEVQFKDLRRSLVGTGQFKLADTHKQFAVNRSVWAGKTPDEKEKHYKRFRSFVAKDPRIVTSTDGESNVVAPKTKGKKLNQGKRKRTERTLSLKKMKT